MHEEILSFRFREIDPKLWWSAEPGFDELIRGRFLGLLQAEAAGQLHEWRATAWGRLAEVIVLDQFSRNVYRNTPQAFTQDPIALALAQEAVAAGGLASLDPTQRSFLLLPYMHSESRQIHVVAEPQRQVLPGELGKRQKDGVQEAAGNRGRYLGSAENCHFKTDRSGVTSRPMLNYILGKDLAHYVTAHRGLLICSLALTALAALFVVIPLYLIQPFIDEGMKTGTDPVTWKIPWVTFHKEGGFSWNRTEVVLLDGVSPNHLIVVLASIAFLSMLIKSGIGYLSELASTAFSNRAIGQGRRRAREVCARMETRRRLD